MKQNVFRGFRNRGKGTRDRAVRLRLESPGLLVLFVPAVVKGQFLVFKT
jgi:hypothetical protein